MGCPQQSTVYAKNDIMLWGTLKYVDVPHHYRWDNSGKQWVKRVQNTLNRTAFPIGRIVYVSPSENERFYLSILLSNITPFKMWEHMKLCTTELPNNIDVLKCGHPTFQSACSALGLLQCMEEWIRIMDEASHHVMSPNVRFIFLLLLLFCDVTEPVKLFEQFWKPMGDFAKSKLDTDRQLQCVLNTPPAHYTQCQWHRLLVLHCLHYTVAQEYGSADGAQLTSKLPPLSHQELHDVTQAISLPTIVQQHKSYDREAQHQSYEHHMTYINNIPSQCYRSVCC